MTSFAIVNQCSDPQLTPDLLAQICIALTVQLNRDVASWWGGAHRARDCSPDNPPADGEVVALILDDLPDAPGAVAYHAWQGVASIYVARNQCVSLTTGTYSLSQALSHEMCETVGDIGTNLWADDMAGAEWAHELCDAVEAGFYTINTNGPGVAVDVCDFVLPSFFNPGDTSGKYSFLGAAPAPFTTAPGGYQIQRTSDRAPITVQGTIHPDRMAKKRHWSSRTRRRGVKL